MRLEVQPLAPQFGFAVSNQSGNPGFDQAEVERRQEFRDKYQTRIGATVPEALGFFRGNDLEHVVQIFGVLFAVHLSFFESLKPVHVAGEDPFFSENVPSSFVFGKPAVGSFLFVEL